MSIPWDSPLRGCAAAFPQPVDEYAARSLLQTVSEYNSNITFRSSDREHDITHHVFRWNSIHYAQVFENGFQARPQGDTPSGIYFNLYDHIVSGGIPLDPNRNVTHAFVSTTLDSSWRPDPPRDVLPQGGRFLAYRYEIYAPGGIWVSETLGSRYERYRSQDEVSFVRGIAPQYIRSAQLWVATRPGARFPRWERADHRIIINMRFNPQTHPERLLVIRRPLFDYRDEDGRRPPLTIVIWFGGQAPVRVRRELKKDDLDDIVDWYTNGVADSPGYINAAFRSSRSDEAYLFMQNEYVLVNYAPGTTDDRIVNGPRLICDGFPSLSGTAFGEYGIDCAFNSHRGNESFIFSGNLCAHIDYAPGTTDDKILDGPMTITAMFPFFENTAFANSIDAAFTATASNEAYLFKGDSYALINYDSKTCIAIRRIRDGFHSLVDTIFESGIQAAFASHRKDEAYIFKGDQYALINFAPGTTDDYIIGGVKPIVPNWPSLSILPLKNRGLDEHGHTHDEEQAHPQHDQL